MVVQLFTTQATAAPEHPAARYDQPRGQRINTNPDTFERTDASLDNEATIRNSFAALVDCSDHRQDNVRHSNQVSSMT